ncbi:Zinc finger, RING/FYVE/PHD-type [Phytophthora cactorum]|nr:Zinc finger, RING/FYVE/PHD-type [Phytophthora cactorum]
MTRSRLFELKLPINEALEQLKQTFLLNISDLEQLKHYFTFHVSIPPFAVERSHHVVRLGDVVRFDRGQYSHVALYVGGGRVVHLWGESDFQVRVDSIRFVQGAAGSGSEPPESFRTSWTKKCSQITIYSRLTATRSCGGHVETRRDPIQLLGAQLRAFRDVGALRIRSVASGDVQCEPGAGRGHGGSCGRGMAGFVVGGLISLFAKADALTTSAGTGASMGASATTSLGDDEEEEQMDEQVRRATREMLWNGLPAACAPAAIDAMTQMENWVETRRRSAAKDSERKYSDERHNTLANRLAEEELQCSICYSDLLRVHAVAFPCDHFTCAVCYAAFQGDKCCPYCRLPIADVKKIHKSTKLRAKHLLHWDDE